MKIIVGGQPHPQRHSQILSHLSRETLLLHGCRIKSGSGLWTRLATNCTPDEEMTKIFRHCLETNLCDVTQVYRLECKLCELKYQSRYNFGSQMASHQLHSRSRNDENIRHCLETNLCDVTQVCRQECKLCELMYQIRYNFGSQMIPAEFLIKYTCSKCLVGCLASRSQSTNRQATLA